MPKIVFRPSSLMPTAAITCCPHRRSPQAQPVQPALAHTLLLFPVRLDAAFADRTHLYSVSFADLAHGLAQSIGLDTGGTFAKRKRQRRGRSPICPDGRLNAWSGRHWQNGSRV